MKRLLILLLTFALLLPVLAEDNYPENIPCEYEGQTYFLIYDAQRGVFRLKDEDSARIQTKLDFLGLNVYQPYPDKGCHDTSL